MLDQPGSLHIFIGSNNAGKTTLLDAVDQLSNITPDVGADIEAHFELSGENGKKLDVVQKKGTITFVLDGQALDTTEAREMLKRHVVRLCATSPVARDKFIEDYQSFKNMYPAVHRQFLATLSRHIPQLTVADEVTATFRSLGAGFQQVLVILMYLFHPQYTVLLLEEPEIHLHPALIKRLLRVVEEENRYNQVFLTTHSPLFIHTMNLHRLFRVTRERESTVVFSPRLIGKQLDYRRLTQELNADNTEMFFADKVLLVEGPSDHLLMRGMIDRFYRGGKDVKVIQTYGKSNVDVYAELLEIFHIPYVIMLDREALYDTGIQLFQKLDKKRPFKTHDSLINKLKRKGIFILPNGSIENNYPEKYQQGKK
ncbi:MAG: AAA family ATPase, partial [Parcubacteria group bacterium]